MSAEPKYFRSPLEISILSDAAAIVIGCLNQGRTGGNGAVTISASSRSYSIRLDGQTIARGKTPLELTEKFKDRRAQAVRSETVDPK